MGLSRNVAVRLFEQALHRSPRELWALISPKGRIIPLETVSLQSGGEALDDSSLLLLGEAESQLDRPWLLAHSHPKGRALLSARDRLLMVAGGRPAWSFPLLVAGLRPRPVLAWYEWQEAIGDFVVVARRSDEDWLALGLSQRDPGTRPA